MERASELIAKIIDRGAFHPNPLVDMTARKDAALRRAWKILAQSELVDGELYCKALDKYDELTNKHIALQLEFENFQHDMAADYAAKVEECEELEKKLDNKTDECIELQRNIEALHDEIASLKEGLHTITVID